MAATAVYVSIIIFKGEPLDYQKYRHTSLWFQFADQSPPLMIHAVGPPQEYVVQVREAYDPRRSRTFVRAVDVGRLRPEMTKQELVALITSTMPNNSSREHNCQTWIGDVLADLRKSNLLTEEELEKGLDGMVDAISEAEDELQ